MSVRTEYTLASFAAYLRGLPASLQHAAVRGIQAGVARSVGVAQRAGDRAKPASDRGKVGAFDTGNYRRRWRAVTLADGAALSNDATYADVIRRGRRAGRRTPPLIVIERWAMRRLGLSKAEAKRAAFPISRAIARRGLRGREVPDNVVGEVTKVVYAEVGLSVDRALRGEP